MTLKKFCAVAALSLLPLATAQSAPLYQYTLSVADTGSASFSGTGTIGLNALTGNSTAAPAFESFQFSVLTLDGAPAGQLPLVFGAASIASIQWIIDPITFALQLDLDTATQTDGANNPKLWDLSLDTLGASATSVLCNSPSSGSSSARTCYAQNRNQADVGGSSALTVTGGYVPPNGTVAVPEPATFGLFGLALIAMGVSRRKRA